MSLLRAKVEACCARRKVTEHSEKQQPLEKKQKHWSGWAWGGYWGETLDSSVGCLLGILRAERERERDLPWSYKSCPASWGKEHPKCGDECSVNLLIPEAR